MPQRIPTWRHNHQIKTVSVIEPGDSGSSVLVGSLLKVAGVHSISFGVTSEELSSLFYKHFYRTLPSDECHGRFV